MGQRPRWSCPDLPLEQRHGHQLPVVGTGQLFDVCPASFLRVAGMDLPAPHLLSDGTHVAALISEWAREVESGSRNVDTLSTKGREGVHLWLREKSKREDSDFEIRRLKRGR